MFWLLRCFVPIAALSISLLAVRADSVALSPSGDTSLWQENDTNNLGGELSLPVGGNGSGYISRGLLRFDLGSIPTNALVTNVTLRLFVTNAPAKTNPVNSTFVLHRVLRDWGEGNKKNGDVGKNGAPATAGEATWDARFYPNTLWTVPGASAPQDYDAKLSATNFITVLGPYTFAGTSLIGDVQMWVSNPATNFGWMLRSLAETNAFSTRRFASREDGLNPPLLTVMFTLSAIPPPKLFPGAWTPSNFTFSFSAVPGQTYGVEYSDALGTAWHPLTNILAPPSVTNIPVIDNAARQPQRFYRVKIQ